MAEDWRNAEDYAYTARLKPREWAWEFLRRNPDYLAFWSDYVAYLTPELGDKSIDDHSPESMPSELHRRYRDFGLSYQLNPDRNAVELRDAIEQQWGRGVRIYFTDSRPPERLYYHEAAVIVDLRLPLDYQLAEARQALAARVRMIDLFTEGLGQRSPKIAVPKVRRRPKDWVKWLRVLDADRAGARPAEIARVLFPNHRAKSRSAKLALEQGRKYATSEYRRLLRQVSRVGR